MITRKNRMNPNLGTTPQRKRDYDSKFTLEFFEEKTSFYIDDNSLRGLIFETRKKR